MRKASGGGRRASLNKEPKYGTLSLMSGRMTGKRAAITTTLYHQTMKKKMNKRMTRRRKRKMTMVVMGHRRKMSAEKAKMHAIPWVNTLQS